MPVFIGCRNSGRGDKTKPLCIYAPESESFTRLKTFVTDCSAKYLHYPLDWIEIQQGQQIAIPITNKVCIASFNVEHTYNSRGYKIMEERKRLKEWVDPSKAKELKDGGIDIYDIYDIPTFVWLLDSHSFDLSHIQNAVHVVFDATFITAKDCDKGDTHSSIEEV